MSYEVTEKLEILKGIEPAEPEPLEPTGCRISQFFSYMIQTKEGKFCNYCYEVCLKGKIPIVKTHEMQPNLKCECEHDEIKEFLNTCISSEIKNIGESPLRFLSSINALLCMNKEEKPFLSLLNEEAFFFLKKDLESLIEKNFKWVDIDITDIEIRTKFLRNVYGEIPQQKLIFFNSAHIEELLPLKFFSLLLENINYQFGEPIYNSSWDFNTIALDIFIKYHLEKDLADFDKIDSENIYAMSPFARETIRNNNLTNERLKNKYFNQEFNVVKFAIKCIEKFIPGASWNWVGGSHHAHVNAVKMNKILLEYGLMNEEEMEDLKMNLYNKIPTLSQLEKKMNSANEEQFEGMVKIREYYSEILISYLYFKQDKEIILMLKIIYDERKKISIKDDVSLKFVEKIISFNKTILFEKEFGRKMLDFLLGYIMAQNKIKNKLVESRKSKNIVGNFLFFIAAVSDPYLISMKLIQEIDYENYMNYLNSEGKINQQQKTQVILKDLEDISTKIIEGAYLYNENDIIKEISGVLDKIDKIFLFSYIFTKSDRAIVYEKQRILGTTLIINKISSIVFLFMEDEKYWKKEEDFKKLWEYFSQFLKFYLSQNYDTHSSYFNEERIITIQKAMIQYPLEITSLLKDIFKEEIQVMITKKFILPFILSSFSKLKTKFDQEDSEVVGFESLKNLFDILEMFVDIKKLKIFDWIPQNDLQIAEEFVLKEQYASFFKTVTYEELFKTSNNHHEIINNKDKSLNEAHLNFLMSFLKLMVEVSFSRYTDAFYKKFSETFTKEVLHNLINLSGERYDYKEILLDLYSILHIDLKSHLIDNRSSYYSVMPLEPDYSEDSFYDQEYNKTIEMFIQEIQKLQENFDNENNNNNEETVKKYLSNGLFPAIFKLVNFFLMVKEDNLIKLTQYVPKLEKLYECVCENSQKFNNFFCKEKEEIKSPNETHFLDENQKFLPELKDVDQKFQLKREKIKFRVIPKLILDKILESISEKNLNYKKMNVVRGARKSVTKRITFAINHLNKIANQMKVRKQANMFLSLDTLKKKTIQINEKKKLDILNYLVSFYRQYKMTKMSTEVENNIYISSLRNNSSEIQILTYNFCSSIHNRIVDEWDDQNVMLIECICNSLFISTETIQKNMLKVITSSKHQKIFSNVWQEILKYISFVQYKADIDVFWKQDYKILLILIKFHHFLCEDGCSDFKNLIADEKVSDKLEEKYYRIDAWMKIFQNLCDNCRWHICDPNNELSDFDKNSRPQLFPVASTILEAFTEFCTGPQVNSQKKLYMYPYDRYNGILNRYTMDMNSQFYKVKASLLDFILAMSEGNDPDIINYQSTNFELHRMYNVLINSLRQLFYCYILKQPMEGSLKNYPLKMKDYKKIIATFEGDSHFSNHILFSICVKIFSYFRIFAEVKSKYDLFLKERAEALQYYRVHKKMMKWSISEEDLLTFKFFNKIMITVEIQRSKHLPLVSYNFIINPKCLFLSEETKLNFLHNVDRSSSEAKVTALIANSEYFKNEMEYSQKRFKKAKNHRFFGSGLQVYILEILTFLFCIVNNLILLITYEYGDTGEFRLTTYGITVFAIGVLEIIFSCFAILTFFYINYPVYVKNNKTKYLRIYAYKAGLNILDKFYVYIYQSIFAQKIMIFIFHIVFVVVGLNASFGVLTFDLLCIIPLFPTMKQIVESITAHYDQLLNILIMAVIFMFTYSFYTHLNFVGTFLDIDTYLGSDLCSSLSHCFLTIIDKGFRNGEGIGGLIDTPYYGEESEGGDFRFYGTIILNITFFLIINIIILNLILAVLVDTFSQLRKQSDMFIYDSEEICFICNLEKFHFEKAKIDFDKHRRNEHYIWDYVNFLIIMDEKTEKDCNGIEGELYTKIKTGDYSWIPLRRSKSIEYLQEFSANVTLDELISKQNENLSLLTEAMDSIKELKPKKESPTA